MRVFSAGISDIEDSVKMIEYDCMCIWCEKKWWIRLNPIFNIYYFLRLD
jgi:hypothetical protein